MTNTKAAMELDAIRNNRTSSPAELQSRVDVVGRWLASQKYSKKNAQLLQECHELSIRLGGVNIPEGSLYCKA